MIRLKITAPNGDVWIDTTTWVEIPDQEQCNAEYDPDTLLEFADTETGEEEIITTY